MSRKVDETVQEKEYYPAIRNKLENLLGPRVDDLHLRITAEKGLSRQLKSHVRRDREIVFVFLNQARPDITGLMTRRGSTDFVVVEVKKTQIKLDDIYQTRKYMDLLEARLALLVSVQPIPEEIKRLADATVMLLHTPSIRHWFVLTHFDPKDNEFKEWYPKNPLAQEYAWD